MKIHGEKFIGRAQIHTLGGFRAHVGQEDLLTWLDAVVPSKPSVALTHGEGGPRKALAREVQKRFGLKASLPRIGEVVELWASTKGYRSIYLRATLV